MSDRLDQILLLLGEIKGDVKGVIKNQTEHEEQDRLQFSAITRDLDSLKGKIKFGHGFASGIGAVIGSLSTLWFKGH